MSLVFYSKNCPTDCFDEISLENFTAEKRLSNTNEKLDVILISNSSKHCIGNAGKHKPEWRKRWRFVWKIEGEMTACVADDIAVSAHRIHFPVGTITEWMR